MKTKVKDVMGVWRLWRCSALMLACILACWSSGSAQPIRSPGSGSGSSSRLAAKTKQTLLYVALYNAKAVNIYDASGNGQPMGQLLDGLGHGGNATGPLAVDQHQKVYVSTTDMVLGYPKGIPVPWMRYDFLDQPYPATPFGMAFGPDGTLYAPLVGQYILVAYAKANPKKASLTVSMPSGMTAYAAATDAQNNLYIEYGGVGKNLPGYIEKCLPNSNQCTDLGITLGAPGYSLAVDSQGNLIACDLAAAQIDVFPPGSTQPRVISQGLMSCPTFALNHAENTLFVANQSQVDGQSNVSVFDYASGNLLNTISGGIPSGELIVGVALSPSLR